MSAERPPPATALLLTGGGARAAYQAGVLLGIKEILLEQNWPPERNPFPILVGASAGAINAAFLAAQCQNWARSVDELVAFWRGLHSGQVFEARTWPLMKSGLRWLALMALGWVMRVTPRSLLDNAPLAELLNQNISAERIRGALQSNALRALAISASSYTSGAHWTFYQMADQQRAQWARWQRPGRRSSAQVIETHHLLASSALPFIFPPQPLFVDNGIEFFGDGAMRQVSPLSPAVHLGAERILVIGTGREGAPLPRAEIAHSPSPGQIAAHAMAALFQDTLSADIEQALRITRAMQRLERQGVSPLPFAPLRLLEFEPSRLPEFIAPKHLQAMPRLVRRLLTAVGGTRGLGAALASYLLFEPPYLQALIELGHADALAQRHAVGRLFGAA